ncbi:MAG: hypothetical protein J5836_03235 [Clostridia bacterium]|nr:hypothetical protein [Clostridia bacterium]
MSRDKSINFENGFYEDIVKDVMKDYENRREERRAVERQWQLNLNFLNGNQYCEITSLGEIEEDEKFYYWQNRNVYNHIAPVIETRIARLSRMRPIMSVRASGGDENDLKTAKLTTSILNSTCARIDLPSLTRAATVWSEVCGTAFYEVTWDGEKGTVVGNSDGKEVKDGDISVSVVSPFEIFPDCMAAETLEECRSVIHARAMHVDEAENRYGVRLKGGDVEVFTLSDSGSGISSETVAHDRVVVVERFERPSPDFPNGRVTAVAGDTLLYIGELPFVNGESGKRDFPFVMQKSISVAGKFFGISVIERLIPLQRSYNAVKNRKQEFLNRISMGVFAVEDGSVDVDELAEEGLSPGKVVVYRQGSNPPTLMSAGSVPLDFTYEEERLTNEFILISGVSEFSRTSRVGSNVSSGTALQLLIEQDDTRLSFVAENIRNAVKKIGQQIIRLFKQFADVTRIMKVAGENGKVETLCFTSSDISSDDVVFDTENELSYTPAQKKTAVYELLNAGLLSDADGKLSERTKSKVLEILGFGSVAAARDMDTLHINKAETENMSGYKSIIDVDEYDDHEIHVFEHTRFLLSAESENVRNNPESKQNALAHLRAHKKALAIGEEK